MHLYVFIAILVPKLLAILMHLFPSVREYHRWRPRWHKPYLKTKLCIYMLHTAEVMAICVIFWPILATNWLLWQRVNVQSEMYSLDWSTTKTPCYKFIFSISLVEMYLYAFTANLAPELVAMVTSLCRLWRGLSHMNSPMTQTLSQNQTLHLYVAYSWSYDHFCDCLANFGRFWPKFGCHGNVP